MRVCRREWDKPAWPGVVLAGLLVAGLALSQPVAAYNGGHHWDLTRDALRAEEFGMTAVRIAQVENFFTDYFDSSPTSTVHDDMVKLHFTGWDNTGELRNYWGRLCINMKQATEAARAADKPLRMLALLGLSLHVVQDFYGHSTWADSHPRKPDGSFDTDTWFGGALPEGAAALSSANHAVMNKDYYGRPYWEPSYVSAYVASREWIRAVARWAKADTSPAFWHKVRMYSVSGDGMDDLNYDCEAAYRLSEWLSTSAYDGVWKSPGSGSLADFVAFAAGWTAAHDSVYVQQIKDAKVHKLLSDGLRGDAAPPGTPPAVDPMKLSLRAVIVRTLQVQGAGGLDTPGDPDLFARVWINGGLPFTESMQLGKTSFAPPWESVGFVEASETAVPVKYAVWDEDGGLAGDDDPVDIKPTSGYDLNLQFNPGTQACSGDVTGVHNTEATAVTMKGTGGDWGSVKFYVASAPVVKRVLVRPPALRVAD
jgi:hypothetical protein